MSLTPRKFFVVALMAACGALSPVALQIVVPVLPYIRAEFGTSIAATQWVVTGFAVSLGAAMLVFGPLSDLWGRRRLLIAGVGMFTAGSVVAFFAPSLELLIAGRVLQAFGAGAATTISRAVAADLFGGTDLGRVFAYMTMAIVVGPMIAPIAAGLIADAVGWSWVMVVLAAAGFLATIVAATGMPETAPAGAATVRGPGARVLLASRFSLYLAVLVATQVGVYAFISASPYTIVELLGRSATEYGLFFVYMTLGFLGGNFLSTRIAHRLGPDRTIAAGLVGFALAFVVLAFFVLSGRWSALTLFGPATVLAACNGLVQPNCHAAAMLWAGAARGTAASLTGFTQVMAGGLGLQVMAWLQPEGGSPVPMVGVIGTAAVAALLLAAVLGRRAAPPQPA